MVKVLIVYATDFGSTKKIALAVADGVRTVDGVNCVLRPAEETTVEDMLSSDALIFGSPVHMGSLDWRLKKFFDTTCSGLWMKDRLVGKVGGVFATGSGFGNSGAGAELAMLSMLANLAELGLILVTLPRNTPGYEAAGLHWGPCARTATESMQPTGFSEAAAETARRHGANIARLARELAGKKIFSD